MTAFIESTILRTMNWSKRVLKLRKNMRMSQRQFADLFAVAPGTISLWEKDQRQLPGPAKRLVEILEYNQQLQKEGDLQSFESSSMRRAFKTGVALSRAGQGWVHSKVAPWYMNRDRAIDLQQHAQQGIMLEFIKTMTELRGLHLKLVQMFSMMREGLSDDLRKFFETYQSEIKPMSPTDIVRVFVEDFGRPPSEVFESFESLPFAFGSISQVHLAKLNGQDYAVKVQYPGIVDSLKGDLKNLDIFARFFSKVMGFKGTDAMILELQERFLEECDYALEIKHLEQFAKLFEGQDWIKVPEVLTDFCSARVLTMEHIKGKSLDDMVASGNSDEKDQFAQSIFRFHFESIYQHLIYNADPHPGNYKWTDGRLVVLDFGCIREFSKDQISRFRAMFEAVFQNDLKLLEKSCLDVGIVENPEKFDYLKHYEAMVIMMEPVYRENFRFNHYYVREIVRKLVAENPNLKHARMVQEVLFIQRLQFGMYSLLAELDASGPWREIYENATGFTVQPPTLHSII